jgi:hypothetical protein
VCVCVCVCVYICVFVSACVGVRRGVDKFFKTVAKLASILVFSLAKAENNWAKL